MAPRIPYLEIADFTLVPAHLIGSFPPAPIALKPFGTLVACGVYFGCAAAVRHARKLGMSERAMVSFLTTIVITSFILGHMLDTLSYYPEEVLRDPWVLVRLWEGLSSFGGFTGALVAGVIWRFRHKVPLLAYADVVAASFPVSWTFGRLGCTIAHDHPGVRSNAWYAVQYPDGGRLDLGLYELLITIPLMIVFLRLQAKPRPWGFYAGVMCTYYAPLRFLLDFLREREDAAVAGLIAGGDARYLGLTPAQWCCVPLLGLGLYLLHRSRTSGTELPPVPEKFRRSRAKRESAASHASTDG
jgi:phosphatidylglycerol---prolipoprotein diacylglyceryl transferase